MDTDRGAWIFLSHSTKDWDKVRVIRNLLEDKGHRPLVFFLKCLKDQSELDELIKREIDARRWFLLCDSENAKQSAWVQAEVEYIKQSGDRYFEEIYLNEPLESQIEKIDRLCKRATVFLSYATTDKEVVDQFAKGLVDYDYDVWFDRVVPIEQTYSEMIKSRIDQAVHEGFVLIMLSRHSMLSRWVREEVEYAFEKKLQSARGGNVLPILIDDYDAVQEAMPQELKDAFNRIQWFDLSAEDFDRNIAELAILLRNHVME